MVHNDLTVETVMHTRTLLSLLGMPVLLSATLMELPPGFWNNTCASRCEAGVPAILTSTSIEVPTDLNDPQSPNYSGWRQNVSDMFHRSYNVLITGGTGQGSLRLEMHVTGRGDLGGPTSELAHSGSFFADPLPLRMQPFAQYVWWPNSCTQCRLSFTYGEPFTLRMQAQSVSFYQYGRVAGRNAALSGNESLENFWLDSQAQIALGGVWNRIGGAWVPNATANITASPVAEVANPEPGTLITAGLAFLVLGYRRLRIAGRVPR